MGKTANLISQLPSFTQRAQILGFILFPLLMLPDIIKESYRGKLTSQILLCIFLGLLSVLTWPPRADTYRHALIFYKLMNMDYYKMMDYYFRGDVVLLFGSFIFGKIGLSFEFLRLIIMSIAYGVAFHVYNVVVKARIFPEQNDKFIFIMCLFMVPFFDISYAIRYGFALVFIAAYIIFYYAVGRRKITDYLYLLMGLAVHFGTIWLVVIALLGRFLPNKSPKWIIISLPCCAIILSMYSQDILASAAGLVMEDRTVNMYTDVLSERFITHNLVGTILEYIRNLPIYLSISIVLFLLPYNSKTKILFFIVLLWAFSFDLWEINRRIGTALVVVTSVYFCYIQKYRKYILCIIGFTCLISVLMLWRQYTVSNILFLLAPLPISIFQSYSLEWIDANVLNDGTLKVQIK